MIKFFFAFFSVAFSLTNAAEGIISRPNIPPAFVPYFYEERVVEQRGGAAQNPVYLEEPVDSNYIVGPGDFFEILLPSGQDGLQVSPEGTVALQGCGLVYVNGLKLSEAKQRILEKLKNRYDQKFIGVHLVQLRRFVVNVQGAVGNPGQVVVSGQTRVKAAVHLAGNFKATANLDSIYIYRGNDTIATIENILLQNGDVINVPYKEWRHTIDLIYVGKIVTVPHVPKRTIKEYVKEAGINMDKGYAQVSIKSSEEIFTRWLDIDQIDSFSPPPLSEIEFHVLAPYVYVGGAVAGVGKVPYNPSMHPADYVAASGIIIITGDFSDISVMRNGKKIPVDWATGEILPGDFIEIPRSLYERVKDVTLFITSLLSILAAAITIASY